MNVNMNDDKLGIRMKANTISTHSAHNHNHTRTRRSFRRQGSAALDRSISSLSELMNATPTHSPSSSPPPGEEQGSVPVPVSKLRTNNSEPMIIHEGTSLLDLQKNKKNNERNYLTLQ
mmetsp:Transcript_21956/g.32884  ORF Transcript_21956/g.32884 Transcript_21956/m.32884 type:complete len:118 (+) Transcript_21956:547-900(+)|eukprot:CAMPEP_0203671484 /NCGR_PEP_ID=MMETSP0090-20130426/7262_1 /ASSEMBLY_ACC=CAM_ASM_001088 /TAXON_ID=426623 /ORGANISM="Chaetoceros affinis, Strain CCMP159" /LENGTH=117 /DNA_ID=CAMNT_0050536565 /DNA_START=489 /DNA_END=842 /DNA_ORIENTATION=-